MGRTTPASIVGRTRSVLEVATHRLVVRRRLPPPYAGVRLHVSSEGGLRYLFRPMGAVDPLLLRLVAACVGPGDRVWDVGANVGLFAFTASGRAGSGGHVLAVEPDVELVRLLRRSAAGLPPGWADVAVLPAAAARAPGVARLCIARRCRATNFLEGFGTTQTGGVRDVQLVPAVTLDGLVAEMGPPSVLKVDVEGAEVEVLEGARGVLADCAPVVVCEVAGESAPAVTALLRDAGYEVYDGEAPRLFAEAAPLAPYHTVALPPGHPARAPGRASVRAAPAAPA